VFAYHITIGNQSECRVQLLDRHWVISEQGGSVREVEGQGVIGEQPVLEPGEEHQYSSGAILGCPDGSMQGSYGMIGEDGETFRVSIPRFELNMPRTLH
jgi:ApaG protein